MKRKNNKNNINEKGENMKKASWNKRVSAKRNAASGKSVYEIITGQIIEKLEAGVIPWEKPWAGGGKAMNLISKKAYRGINTLLLGMQDYKSPYWLTYKQAAAKGGNVRKGEKGTMVTFYKTYEKKAKDTDADADDKGYTSFVLRYYTVFNLEQCDGIANPDKEEEERDFSPLEQCEKAVNEMPFKPSIEHKEQRAYYRPMTDAVNMPKPETFNNEENYYSTLFHELIHSTGSEGRLGRHKQDGCNHMFGSKDYSKEELVAEMGASFLCGHTEILNSTIDNSAAYIKSWISKLKNDPKMIIQAASKAQAAAEYILNIKAN